MGLGTNHSTDFNQIWHIGVLLQNLGILRKRAKLDFSFINGGHFILNFGHNYLTTKINGFYSMKETRKGRQKETNLPFVLLSCTNG